MKFVRLTSSDDPMYRKAMALYEASFPYHEQREECSQRHILNCDEYYFYLLYEENCFVGMLLCWETQDFIYIEHFCIDPQMRNQNFGGKALQLLREKGKCILLEIDPPVEELSKRRKSFYERAGFKENAYKHIHPPYHRGNAGHALTVMSLPDVLAQSEYDAFCLYLKNTVMGNDASSHGSL